MNYTDDLIEMINKVCSSVSDDELTGLRIKEELLTMLIKKQGMKLSTKKEAFSAMEIINRRQLEVLGCNTRSLAEKNLRSIR